MPALAQAEPTSGPPAMLHNTETFTLHSDIVGDDYLISIAYPFEYRITDESFPVLYVLDPHFFFGTVTEQTRLLQASEELPQLLIVGIGYPAGRNVIEMRGRDYVVARDFNVAGSKEPEAFRRFIGEELIPHIEANFRVLPDDRAIVGYSFGGLFTLYSFAKQPEMFQRYILVSPALPWEATELDFMQARLLPDAESISARLYMSVGELEGSHLTMQALAEILNAREDGDLEVNIAVIRNATHYSAFAVGLINGLQTVYCNPPSRYSCD
jgi:hypothetical protein